MSLSLVFILSNKLGRVLVVCGLDFGGFGFDLLWWFWLCILVLRVDGRLGFGLVGVLVVSGWLLMGGGLGLYIEWFGLCSRWVWGFGLVVLVNGLVVLFVITSTGLVVNGSGGCFALLDIGGLFVVD